MLRSLNFAITNSIYSLIRKTRLKDCFHHVGIGSVSFSSLSINQTINETSLHPKQFPYMNVAATNHHHTSLTCISTGDNPSLVLIICVLALKFYFLEFYILDANQKTLYFLVKCMAAS